MSHDPVRDEAERLVAAAIAMASLAARGLSGAGGPNLATGGPECCVCPVCRVIAALREPSPELSERLATGAGDLAAGVASMLRSFAGSGTASAASPDEGELFWESLRRHARPAGDRAAENDPWQAATTAATHGPATGPATAHRAAKTEAPSAAQAPSGAQAPSAAQPSAPGKKVAKKAVKKAIPRQVDQ